MGKLVVIGADADGKSVVAEVRELEPQTFQGGIRMNELWDTDEQPPAYTGPRISEGDQYWPVTATPGGTAYRHAVFPPDIDVPFHSTDAFQYIAAVNGSATLLLERGSVEVTKGDFVVLQGSMHGWHIGPDGYEEVTTLLGLG
jgi:quercetin dioxygenase-like cupin family protein